MAVDCLYEPPAVAFLRTFGTSLAILGAVAAWLINNFVRWRVWKYSESRREYELLKGLSAEIKSFSGNESEGFWADAAKADDLVLSLEKSIGPLKSLAPYLVLYEETIVFDEIKKSLALLPAELIDAIVSYYYQTLALNKQLLDFRSEFFANMNRERQRAAIKNTFRVGKSASNARETALRLIEESLRAFELRRRLLRQANFVAAFLAIMLAIAVARGSAGEPLLSTVKSAVEWASSCDLLPKNTGHLDMGPRSAIPIPSAR